MEQLQQAEFPNEQIVRFSYTQKQIYIDDEGDIEIPTLSLDKVVGNDKVTFIKMDIEGTELEALKGASCIIQI